MSFCTSFSSNLRPIRRLTAKIVFFALVTACRLAGAPTRISPSSRVGDDRGRRARAFGVLDHLGRAAFHDRDAAVGRAEVDADDFAIVNGLRAAEWVVWLVQMGFSSARINPPCAGAVAGAVRRLRHRDQRRAQHPVVDQVALLEHRDDGVGRLIALDHLHRLVPVRVEFLAGGVDLGDLRAWLERGVELFQRELDAALQRFGRYRRVGRERLLERVLDRRAGRRRIFRSRICGPARRRPAPAGGRSRSRPARAATRPSARRLRPRPSCERAVGRGADPSGRRRSAARLRGRSSNRRVPRLRDRCIVSGHQGGLARTQCESERQMGPA